MSNDDTQPASGSRWEQPAGETPDQTSQPAPAPLPAEPAPAYAPASPSGNRGRLLLAGSAIGIALVAGTGGFVLGQVTADGDDVPHRFGGPGLQGNFPGGGPMGGRQDGPHGMFPGQPGQPPDGFGDHDDDDQQLPDDSASDGASEGSTSSS